MAFVLRQLYAGYGRNDILKRISATLPFGQVTVIIGPNGSGKSTLLRCLASLLPIRSGTLRLQEKELKGFAAKEAARHIAYVAQEMPTPFAFTVAEFVQLGRIGASPDAQRVRIGEVLRQFDLSGYESRALQQLSGGERQRVALARAVAQDTPCLLLDEPTAHLDLRHQALLAQWIRSAAGTGNRTVVLVVHDLNLAARLADQVLLLNNGELIAAGTPNQVLTPEVLEPVYQIALQRTAFPGANGPGFHVYWN